MWEEEVMKVLLSIMWWYTSLHWDSSVGKQCCSINCASWLSDVLCWLWTILCIFCTSVYCAIQILISQQTILYHCSICVYFYFCGLNSMVRSWYHFMSLQLCYFKWNCPSGAHKKLAFSFCWQIFMITWSPCHFR